MLLKLLGYSKPIPLHDHTDSRQSLRAIEHQKSGDPLGDPTFIRHVDRVTDADERARKADRILRTRRAWAGSAALLALALLPLATPAGAAVHPLCPAGQGPWSRSELTSDGRFILCLVDATTPGKYELWSAPTVIGNPPVRLSPDLAADRDVIAFVISPDGRRVAFTADKSTWTKYDLFAVPVAGGLVTKLNGPLPVEHDVDDFRWSPGSALVAYRQGRNTTGYWHLYSAAIVAGGPHRLSPDMPPGGAVQRGFQILPDSRVRYSANLDGGATFRWYVVPIAGGPTLTEVFADGFEGGSVGAWS